MNSAGLPVIARDFSTLVEMLQERASRHPERMVYRFLDDEGQEIATESYGGLDLASRTIGCQLQEMGLAGERALLLFPAGLDFLSAFFGCLYGGVVAVPADLPRRVKGVVKLLTIINDCAPTVLLTSSSVYPQIQSFVAQAPAFAALRVVVVDELSGDLSERWRDPGVDGRDLAFLQYTSGSTSAPKGVMVNHSHLIHNEEAIARAFQHSDEVPEELVYVSWLPLFHDMGLIGAALQIAYVGGVGILMAPMTFLRRPLTWLETISRYRARTSGAPNFAYELCCRRVSPDQLASLDLSSWKVAYNGAEPVRAETLERFAATFESCGFQRQAMYPCYGLAEATLFVAGGTADQESVFEAVSALELRQQRITAPTAEADRRVLASCGGPHQEQQVLIVNPETLLPCPRGSVGEIWVAGDSVAGGYWGQPETTEEVFMAQPFGHDVGLSSERFLRTGDLGFLRVGETEELFVTGRRKDLIIIRGRNHYPQDIELTAEKAHEALRPGCGASFSVDVEGEERLVVVYELGRRYLKLDPVATSKIAETVRKAVSESHEVAVYDVVLVRTGSVPKTSSGKIQRFACRTAYLDRESGLPIVLRSSEASPTVADGAPTEDTGVDRQAILALDDDERLPVLKFWLRQEVARVTRLPAKDIASGDALTALGLDSLAAVDLKRRLEEQLGIPVSLTQLLRGCSLKELAKNLLDGLVGGAELPGVPRIQPGQNELCYPLSYGQGALWFLYRLTGRDAAYHVAVAAQMRALPDLGAIGRAYTALAERHPVLRSTIHGPSETFDVPWQQVHAEANIDLRKVDSSGWSKAELEEQLQHDLQRPFDLDEGPLVRLTLFTASDTEYVVLLVLHHIITDFWSLEILAEELGKLYEAEILGTKTGMVSMELPPKFAYSDYVRWQREWLADEEGERQWSYWRDRLGGALPVLDLASDRPRSAAGSYRGASLVSVLGSQGLERLKAFSTSRDVTLYMSLLAVFQTLLHRYTGKQDLLVGSPTNGRSAIGPDAPATGYFVNSLVMRADLSADPSFESYLTRVRDSVTADYEQQDYSLALLAERLQPDREPGRSPLFQVAFALQKTRRPGNDALMALALRQPGTRVRLAGLELTSFGFEDRTTQYDLALVAAELEGTLLLSWHHSVDLFDAAGVHRMTGHFQHLLDAVVQNPSCRLSALPLLSAAEESQLLVEFNATRHDLPPESGVHRIFEHWVEHAPGTPAAVFRGQSLTYDQVNRQANRVARYLQSLGVGPEIRVGLCTGRSPDLVVGALAILKAGGSYVPLDPAYPPDRLAWTMADAGLSVLLTRREYLDGVLTKAVLADLTKICLDQEDVSGYRDENLQGEIDPENAAYVIYTSGSTGRPKGVTISHAGLSNLVAWHRRVYGLTAEDRTTQVASSAFDACVWEIWPTLASGASLHLADEAATRSADQFGEWLVAEQATVCFLPTPLAEAFLAQELPRGLALRALLTGGDRLRWTPANSLPFDLVNHYGPTESTVVATAGQVMSEEREKQRLPTIGKPIDNTTIYLLDRALRPVPMGVPGELTIGDSGLARGYLNRPALTAERFLPDAFSQQVGARLYRTGDLVRYRRNADLAFLGRIDHQLKIRGFRIEPGEIESLLSEHPGVRDAVILAATMPSGERALVACIVPIEGVEPDLSELRGDLRKRLPEHMVPAAFVCRTALPLTPNGKLDRQALARIVPELIRDDLAEHKVPKTPTEEIIAGSWSQLLGVERVGLDDNFFELGGHSLLAHQALTRIRETFVVDLEMRDLFEAPTIKELAAKIEDLRKQDNAMATVLPLSPIARDASRGNTAPLSFAQERMWFLEQLHPGSSLHNIPAVFRLRGSLIPDALQRALHELISRHEILRTTFSSVGGQPMQVIESQALPKFEELDLSDLEGDALAARVDAEINREALAPFDLATGPLLRMRLLRLEDREHLLLMNMHHIVSDGWSTRIMVRELAMFYRASASGSYARLAESALSPLPEPKVQYADFAAWQRSWLSGEVLAKQLDYWLQHLRGAPTLLELPTDRPRPAKLGFDGAHLGFSIPRDLSLSLEGLSLKQGTTLFMTLLGAFVTLLHRYSGCTDIVLGSPVANRNRSEIEELIGLFVNTLALRIDLAGDPSFSVVLERVREVALGAYSHQDLPFEKLVDELEPERSLSHLPLVQMMFVLGNVPWEALELELPGVTASLVAPPSVTSRFDLTMWLEQSAAGIRAVIEYRTELFDSTSIRRLSHHFNCLLDGIVAEPSRSLQTLPLLTAAERGQIELQWNDTEGEFSQACCAHELFETQVQRRPEHLAVIFEDQCLSYAELDRRANRLANYLRSLGVGPEVIVGLSLERSLDLIVGMLAILKAGGAFLPLDPSYPRERLEFMVEDSGTEILLTDVAATVSLPSNGKQRVLLDASHREVSHHSDARPDSEITSQHLAYVIYTSGSTGRPKGALLRHQGLSNLTMAQSRIFATRPSDRVMQLSSLSFDASVFEIFLAFAAGATLHLARRESLLGDQFADLLSERAISTLVIPPSVLANLPEVDLPALQCIVCAGEALPAGLAEYWSCGRRLFNAYGPTEATIWSSVRRYQGSGSPDIGYPILNTRLHIWGPSQAMQPMGVPGELCISGVGLSRGYIGRPGLTAERFVPNPWALDAGGRFYLSGDVARLLADGGVDFLGRTDHQVKIRGFRIEPGEIEATLLQHPGIREAAVKAWRGEHDQRLVAYAVEDSPGTTTRAALRSWLGERLPDYMVPGLFVFLTEMPLSPSGKADHQKLPAPDRVQLETDGISQVPMTPVEELVGAVLGEVLEVESVSASDNFFELGGHSLLATKVISRIRSVCGVDLPVRKLFEAPTVADLALEVERALRAIGGTPAPSSIEALARASSELPLSFAQQRLWFVDQIEPDSWAYNLPTAVRWSGTLSIPALEFSVTRVLERHETLRTSFPAVGGEPVLQVAEPTKISLPIIDLSHLSSADQEVWVKRLGMREVEQPFDLARDCMLRMTLLRLEDDHHVALATMHHIAGDGWSAAILLRELGAVYRACLEGHGDDLPDLPVRYADFAAWQRSWLQGENLEAQLGYWRRQLAGAPTLKLPTDRPRSSASSFLGAVHNFRLSAELTSTIRQLARQEGVTLFMTLLAGFNVFLHRWTGQDDLVVGTDVAGRNRVELEDLIGFFVNNLALRTRLESNLTFQRVLEIVREVTLDAYAHDELPFDLLVRDLKPQRELGRVPLFQVLFVLQNEASQQLELPGLEVQPIDLEFGMAKFDLALFFSDTGAEVTGTWNYSTDLFEASTVARMSDYLIQILEKVCRGPQTRLNQLEVATEMQSEERMESKLRALRRPGRRKATRSRTEVVEASLPTPAGLPLIVRPKRNDLDPIGWARGHRDWIEGKLLEHGALLFRDFDLRTIPQFESFVEATGVDPYGGYGDLPKEQQGQNLYHSTPYPEDKAILFHNESSHMDRWPLRQFFFSCEVAPEGGETPIVDCREIYRRLDSELVEKFASKGLMYVRNFVEGYDVSWQEFFRTEDRGEVDKVCQRNGLEFVWKGEVLETRQLAPAVAQHPQTKEPIFFNQIQLHHTACLEDGVRRSLHSIFDEQDLPRTVRFGDGTPIPDAIVEDITQLYWECSVSLPWQKGDVMMVDNMLCAHARKPFSGPRKVVVAMGNLHNKDA